jgi:hypothetical protein
MYRLSPTGIPAARDLVRERRPATARGSAVPKLGFPLPFREPG